MIITTSIVDSTGATRGNVYFFPKLDTSTAKIDNKIKAELFCYVSEAAYDSGAARIFPVFQNEILAGIEFEVLPNAVVKAGSNCTMADVYSFFYAKVAEELSALTSWNITA